jgi:hypothetical protein
MRHSPTVIPSEARSAKEAVIPSGARSAKSRNLHLPAFLLLAAASTAGAQAKVPVRVLGAPSATSSDTILSIASVRQLPNGNVLLNDQTRHRVTMLDKDLKEVKLVADSTSNTNNAYGVGRGGMIAYRGDSTLFIDPVGLSMLVIDPDGKIVRTMAAPRPTDIQWMTNPAFGTPGFDTKGRLVYRQVDFGMRGFRPPEQGKPPVLPTPPDSSALVRFDLATRKLDTVGFFKIPKVSMSVTQDANGGMRISTKLNPAPVVDEWSVLSNGSVAVVRGQDYHVDFFNADGTVTKAEKVAYEWQHMDDEYKEKFLDSAKTAMEAARKLMATNPQAAVTALQGAAGMGAGGGTPMMVMNIKTNGDGPPPPRRDGGGDAGRGGGNTDVRVAGTDGKGAPAMQLPPVEMVAPSELPDYKPAFSTSSVKADMDGRLWVRTIPTKAMNGVIYDVLDSSGKLVDRVQVPANQTIAGFGAGGVVYLGMRDANGIHLQKATIK